MPTSAYFVTVQTRDSFSFTDYTRISGEITNVLRDTLGDTSKLGTILHSTEFTNAAVEVEVMQVSHDSDLTAPIVARCVIQADADAKLTFDKTLFTNMIRTDLAFPVTISKRTVAKDELVVAAALADEPPSEETA
jgi:hypothetical protein